MNKEIKTDIVIEYLISSIKSGKFKANSILPSENFLIEKFGCSRIIIISAYNVLKKLGIVYSVAKKGYFVAENVHNIIEPISKRINATNTKTKKVTKYTPDWFKDLKIIFDDDFYCLEKRYYKGRNLIMIAEYFISLKYNLDEIEDHSIIDFLTNSNKILKNCVYHLKYEKTNIWGKNNLVVIYMFGYDKDGICVAAKYYIHPDHFHFEHQEFSPF